MSFDPRQALQSRVGKRLSNRQLVLATALLLGLVGGVLAERKPTYAAIVCLVIAAAIALATLGQRGFPWAIALVVVAPWYPFISQQAEARIVRQKVLCAAIAAAALVPWLSSLALGGRRTRPSRAALLMGFLFLGLTILIYESLGSVSAMIDSGVAGYIFAGITFLCARRFADGRAWLGAAFGGLLVLVVLGADAYVRDPSNRIGDFVGSPIT